ncbi:acylphosphatase [Nocardioides terrisoli]|uniref:acylphosphatase n=1 Tax=Nocardioides terrisoli TaxID=3388267 RepID=UPI00287BB54F|nr:acylphosphatase [Nocardioides marmorisolisilvae]
MAERAVEVVVTGLVQGVFFRARCADEARRLGVRGWVANEYDGSVRGHFEGAAEAVDALVSWCREGSPRSRVDRVALSDAVVEHAPGFEAR